MSGANRKTVVRFRRDLVTNPSGTNTTSINNTSPSKNSRVKLLQLLRDRGEGKAISTIYKQITSSVRDVELYYDPNGLPKILFDKLRADPYIHAAAVLSKYSKNFSPMQAKTTWSPEQLNGLLVTPGIVTGGLDRLEPVISTALVLPCGYIVNKTRKI